MQVGIQLYDCCMDAELRDLRLFVVLAEEKHFSRAAAVAGVSQPTLTRSLARLERAVGARLVDRTTRSVELTEDGRRLAADLVDVLPRLDSALRNVSAHPGLRLGFTWLLPSDLVRRAGELFSRDTGGELMLVRRDDRTAGVARGLTDLAVVYGRVPTGESLRVIELGTEDRVAAVARDHPLARRRRLHWAEIAEHPLVVNEASGTVGPVAVARRWPAGRRGQVPHLRRVDRDGRSRTRRRACFPRRRASAPPGRALRHAGRRAAGAAGAGPSGPVGASPGRPVRAGDPGGHPRLSVVPVTRVRMLLVRHPRQVGAWSTSRRCTWRVVVPSGELAELARAPTKVAVLGAAAEASRGR